MVIDTEIETTVQTEVPQFVRITIEEYEQLLEDSRWLAALQCAGVDNWEGYSEAAQSLELDE